MAGITAPLPHFGLHEEAVKAIEQYYKASYAGTGLEIVKRKDEAIEKAEKLISALVSEILSSLGSKTSLEEDIPAEKFNGIALKTGIKWLKVELKAHQCTLTAGEPEFHVIGKIEDGMTEQRVHIVLTRETTVPTSTTST